MRRAKFFIILGVAFALIACTSPGNSKYEDVRSEKMREIGYVELQPNNTTIKEINRTIIHEDLTSNQPIIVNNHLYFYAAGDDTINPAIQDDSVGLVAISPSKQYLAATKGKQDEVIIFNRRMDVEQRIRIPELEDQDYKAVGDLRWMGEERLLIGLDFNSNVRGYYVIDLNRELLYAGQRILAKAGQGVIEALDQQGEQFIYQYPNERSFSDMEKPALYVNDQMVFQGSHSSSSIGKIVVSTEYNRVIFPVIENGQTRFVTGQYELAAGLEHMESYLLELAENEQLLDYALNTELQEGYVLVQKEGERKLYKWHADEAPSLVYLTDLPDSISLSNMVLEDDVVLKIINSDKVYVYMNEDNVFADKKKEVREYLIKKSREEIDQAITEEQVIWIEGF